MSQANTSLIDLYFISPLVDAKLYGEPKMGLSEAIHSRVSNVNGDGLRAAARQIISTRKAGNFPSVPDCVALINANKGRTAETNENNFGEITKQNYFERALNYSRRNGFLPIYREIHVEQWAQWCEYFKHLDLKFCESTMRTPQASGMTVPSLWPSTFDLNYVSKCQESAA